MKPHKAVYFGAIEGTEAIFRLKIKNFPTLVVNDIFGGDLYEEAENKYKIFPE